VQPYYSAVMPGVWALVALIASRNLGWAVVEQRAFNGQGPAPMQGVDERPVGILLSSLTRLARLSGLGTPKVLEAVRRQLRIAHTVCWRPPIQLIKGL
jgi:hypothetical protein